MAQKIASNSPPTKQLIPKEDLTEKLSKAHQIFSEILISLDKGITKKEQFENGDKDLSVLKLEVAILKNHLSKIISNCADSNSVQSNHETRTDPIEPSYASDDSGKSKSIQNALSRTPLIQADSFGSVSAEVKNDTLTDSVFDLFFEAKPAPKPATKRKPTLIKPTISSTKKKSQRKIGPKSVAWR